MKNEVFELIVEGIIKNGYAVADNFLNKIEIDELIFSFNKRYLTGSFNLAKIGKIGDAQLDQSIRGDEILWLEADSPISCEQQLLTLNEDFISYLNSTCFLGITRSEIHYAKYAPGKFYKRHLDSFKNQEGRIFSIIYYLNENWVASDGGNLVLYLDKPEGEEKITIDPIAGRFVCFQSDKLEHEVLVTSKERLSVTGWLVK